MKPIQASETSSREFSKRNNREALPPTQLRLRLAQSSDQCPSTATIQLSPASSIGEVGATAQASASETLTNSCSGLLTYPVSTGSLAWTSSDTTVASVAPPGLVTFQFTGTPTIYASGEAPVDDVDTSVHLGVIVFLDRPLPRARQPSRQPHRRRLLYQQASESSTAGSPKRFPLAPPRSPLKHFPVESGIRDSP